METTKDLLDSVKERKGIPSDYALAAFLGVTRAQVSAYRRDRESLSDEKAIRVADLLGIDQGYVLALMYAECWNVVDKIRDAKSSGAWQEVEARKAEQLAAVGA